MRVEDHCFLAKSTSNNNCSVLGMSAMFELEVGLQDFVVFHLVYTSQAMEPHTESNLVS
jgi:hypothetical protein